MRVPPLWRVAAVVGCSVLGCSHRPDPPKPIASARAATSARAPVVGKRPPRPVSSVVEPPDVGPRLSFVQGPAGRLRLSDGGLGGVPVVFVHGLGGSWQAWSAQLDVLRPNRRAAALDLRGHGESDAPDSGDYAMPALADDVDAVVSLMGFEKFYLVGHSMAGLVLTAYAARHPEKVAGLVFVDAVGDLHRLSKEDQEVFADVADPRLDVHHVYEEMCGQRARPETRVKVLEAVDQMKPGAFAALRRAMVDYVAVTDASRYQGPRACIDAEGNDSVIDAWALYLGVARRRIPGVSHWVMMDDPETFNRLLDGYITPGITP